MKDYLLKVFLIWDNLNLLIMQSNQVELDALQFTRLELW